MAKVKLDIAYEDLLSIRGVYKPHDTKETHHILVEQVDVGKIYVRGSSYGKVLLRPGDSLFYQNGAVYRTQQQISDFRSRQSAARKRKSAKRSAGRQPAQASVYSER